MFVVSCALGVIFKKPLSNSGSQIIMPVFSSKNIRALGLTFESVIYFELIFMLGKGPTSFFTYGYLVVSF